MSKPALLSPLFGSITGYKLNTRSALRTRLVHHCTVEAPLGTVLPFSGDPVLLSPVLSTSRGHSHLAVQGVLHCPFLHPSPFSPLPLPRPFLLLYPAALVCYLSDPKQRNAMQPTLAQLQRTEPNLKSLSFVTHTDEAESGGGAGREVEETAASVCGPAERAAEEEVLCGAAQDEGALRVSRQVQL